MTAHPAHFEAPARGHPGIKFIFAHFGGGATYLEAVVLVSRLPNAYADTCPGWGQWVFRNRMPGLAELNFEKILYGTDNAGEGYGESEKWWTEALLSMGRTEEDLNLYFYENSARILGID